MGRRRCGFTLIELLVVIAIIAILAAMLFPVFARARESARKIQCLSNVKNIAIAVQMYLGDYDRFPPNEHSQRALDLVSELGCQGGTSAGSSVVYRATAANPYLKWPVVLDEYIKNRDVWRCPSAEVDNRGGVAISWAYGTGDWLRYLKDTWTAGCHSPVPCSRPFPTGWGGTVTDSFLQGICSSGEGTPSTRGGGFSWSIGYNGRYLADRKTGAINDPAKVAVIFDSKGRDDIYRTTWVAYPGICKIDCGSTCGCDWSTCADGAICRSTPYAGEIWYATDVEYRKKHAGVRHLGGSNIGYADGHAAWMSAEQILFSGSINSSGWANGSNLLEGLQVCFFPNSPPVRPDGSPP